MDSKDVKSALQARQSYVNDAERENHHTIADLSLTSIVECH